MKTLKLLNKYFKAGLTNERIQIALFYYALIWASCLFISLAYYKGF